MTIQAKTRSTQRVAIRTRPAQRGPRGRCFGLRRRPPTNFTTRLVAAFRAQGHGVDAQTAFARACRFYLGTSESRGTETPGGSPIQTFAPRQEARSITLLARGIDRSVVVIGVWLVALGYTFSIAQLAGFA